ncbi:MAG: DUF4870 domain-containing protein [Chthoniobacterales bacterium]
MDENLPQSDTPSTASSTQSTITVRNWVTITHASPLITFVSGFGHIVAPLVIWLLKKSESPEIDAAGRNVLNFQISYSIYMAVSAFMCLFLIGFVMVPIVFIVWLVLMIKGILKASNGENYIYPWCIRFL